MPDPSTRPDRPRTLARSLGMFFGHIISGFKADPSRDDPQSVDRRTSTHEKTGRTASGERVTLRRTVIEEIEVTPAPDHDKSPDRDETQDEDPAR